MKTQKRIVCSALFALLFVTNVYGAPEGYNDTGDAPKLSDRMKFGVGAGLGWVGGNSFALDFPYMSFCRFADFFGEYKINNRIGVCLSLRPTICTVVDMPTEEEDDVKSWEMECLKIAPTLRVYMGTNKKFCLFLGPQVGYLRNAKRKIKIHNGKEEVLDYFVAEDLEEIQEEKGYEVNRWARGIKFGWDYEFKNGLIIGGIFTSEWATENPDTTKKGNLESSSSAKKLDLLLLQGQQIFYLGYNFAKLFD